MEIYESGGQPVRSWASILDDGTLQQALMTARSEAMAGPLALMPDAHLGMGATVGSVLLTKGIIPAAVGVDIGCGVSAFKTDIRREVIDEETAKRILGRIRETIPSGVGKAHLSISSEARDFVKRRGWPSIKDDQRILAQFGTLGSGNHFAEVSEDSDGIVWVLVHSGSRGIGNMIAQRHIKVAQGLGADVEHRDLAFLPNGSTELAAYLDDMLWAQDYAHNQRKAMVVAAYEALVDAVPGEIESEIYCHHNYSEPDASGTWLSRKGAIGASVGVMGIIPGSMGAATYIVKGKGNADSYNSSPHGAGRMLSRGRARRELDLEEFRSQMVGKVWDDRNAKALLDEAPLAYKPIEAVMEDAKDLVEPVTVLKAFINYKGL